MSNLSPLPAGSITTAALGQALIRGRITSTRRAKFQDGPRHLTVLVMPAADEWTSPAAVEIVSRESLGNAGESWSGKVQITGRRRSFVQVDPSTGESRTLQSANVGLTAVE